MLPQARLRAIAASRDPTFQATRTPVAERERSAYLVGMATLAPEIALTPSAAARVAAIATKQNKPAILRLSVDGGGCSGFQYKFGFADAVETDDTIAETDGVRLVVDSVSMDLVRGCAVDYVESLGGAAFKVENPNAASGCGCGSSFAV
jgi:iron-sulfur cluster insertion protein